MFKFLVRAILAVASLVFLIIFGLRSCGNYAYPRPTEAFYVNDFADMLGPSLENFLIDESQTLYENYEDEPEIGGTQIVFATFALADEGELGSYDKDKIYNEWQIGKNDMGMLVILYFVPVTGVEGEYSLTEYQISTGDKLAEYVGTIDLLNIARNTIDHHFPSGSVAIPYDYDLALGVASFMNEILNVAYGEVYGNPAGVIPQAEFEADYEEYFETYDGPASFSTTDSVSMFTYLFSGFGSSLDKILFGAFLFTFALASGVAVKGGGGFSSGYGLFRHRR